MDQLPPRMPPIPHTPNRAETTIATRIRNRALRGYLNSGVHDAQRDHEFDRAPVRTTVESVTALDAALEALQNR